MVKFDDRKKDIMLLNKVPERLKMYGVEIKRGRCRGFCHNGHDFNMVVKDNYCFCYVCDKSFDIFDVVMFFEKCNFREAMDKLEKPIDFKTYRALKKMKAEFVAKQKEQSEYEKKYWELWDRWINLDNIRRLSSPYSEEYAYAVNKIEHVEYLIDAIL